MSEPTDFLFHSDHQAGSSYKLELNALIFLKNTPYVVNSSYLYSMGLKQECALLERLTNYIYENIDKEIKVADLAKLVHISERSLCRKLKKMTGETPKQLLLNTRIKQAAKLLICGEENITSLGYQIGFNDTSHFIRCFKKYYAVTPKKYRERYVNSVNT